MSDAQPAATEPSASDPNAPSTAQQPMEASGVSANDATTIEPPAPAATTSASLTIEPAPNAAATAEAATNQPPRKGPLSFLSGAITSALFAWGCLLLSGRVVAYYSAHPPHYSARVAQSIATAVKTLVVGMTFLATFTFAFVGLGLFLVFVRSLFRSSPEEPT